MSRRIHCRCRVLSQPLGQVVAVVACLLVTIASALAQSDPLPSWNEGPAKQAILAFVQSTTDRSNPSYVPPEARIAAFDQDGTTWVEQPVYTSIRYCLDRLRERVKANPDLQNVEPYRSVLAAMSGGMKNLTTQDLGKIMATSAGLTVEAFGADVQQWLATARDARWGRAYTELVYQPMLEVMRLLRANGYKTYFVTGGQQDFLRVYAEPVYGIVPEQVVGTMSAVTYGYDQGGQPTLTEEPNLLLVNDGPGKPGGIHLLIGRRPVAAFGNSQGDREMLEYTQAGPGARLMMLVSHDDANREYAYGPDTKIGTFPDALREQAKQKGWIVISMKNDWNRIFSWERTTAQ